MKTTIEERRQKAIEFMKQLNIYKPYIKGFEQENKVCFFERFGGYWVDQEPEIEQKMREIEESHKCTVYAITHEYLDFGECYSFLVVTDYEEEWEDLVSPASRNTFYAFAYVWNKDVEYCSEFGSVGVQSFGGGIKRIA